MSNAPEVDRYMKLKDQINELEKSAVAKETELTGLHKQRAEILAKYNMPNEEALIKHFAEMQEAFREALDNWEGMVANVQNSLNAQ